VSLCRQWGDCFAKKNWQCEILTEPINPQKKRCPFMKPDREITNGNRYLMHHYYETKGKEA
jgi:hypothetical protein